MAKLSGDDTLLECCWY